MTEFQTVVEKYYTSGYNCSETLIRAANEYYHLDLHDEDMKMIAGFGGGMFVGSTCGALVGSVAALSKNGHKDKSTRPWMKSGPIHKNVFATLKKSLETWTAPM